MNDSLRMRCIESLGHLHAQFQDFIDTQRLACNRVPERLPLQQFHGDKVLAVGFVDLVDRANVRVIERGSGEGFALKALAGRGIFLHFGRKEFQGHVPAQLEVFGFVDHTHSAAAELRQNAIMRNSFSDHGRGDTEIFRVLPRLL